MLESIFHALFRYPPVLFRKGALALEPPWPIVIPLLVLAGGIALAVQAYRRADPRLTGRDRLALGGLRALALAVVTVCLLRPVLVVATVVPQRNVVAVVVDDSESMAIADRTGETRAGAAARLLGGESGLLAELAERFTLRLYRLASGGERIAGLDSLRQHGDRTDLARALLDVRADLQGIPVAGVVLLTDGAGNGSTPLTEALVSLQADGVPVHPVGLGEERLEPDLEVLRVDAPAEVLRGASAMVEATLLQYGLDGASVRVDVEDAGRIVASERISLAPGGEATTVRIPFTASEAGTRLLRVHVPPQSGERVAQNNAREALVRVVSERAKILYVEGELRFEATFLRRAVAGDPQLQLVLLQRTGEDKFLRLDVSDPGELAAGFPRTREALFAYRGLILGSIEASYFTADQLRMIEEFVERRGGGLLALGGAHALAAGGYAGTPVANAMPVVPDGSVRPDSAPAFLRVAPTPAGAIHPALQLAATLDSSAARWRRLPPLSSLQPVRRVKPGAVTLLSGDPVEGGDPAVALAYQRYGRGKAIAFPVQDSWAWQMHADVPLEDQTHETLWRQLLRWLVSYVPDPVTVSPERSIVAPGEAIVLRARVADSLHLGVNGAEVTARVTMPGGREELLRLDWAVEEDGGYRGSLAAAEPGILDVVVEARAGGRLRGSARTAIRVAPASVEVFDAGMHGATLRRIAGETGGRFFTPSTAGALPDELRYTSSGLTVRQTYDLWNVPAVLLALLLLLGAEWGYRRARRLA